jgi:hypothetical protein
LGELPKNKKQDNECKGKKHLDQFPFKFQVIIFIAIHCVLILWQKYMPYLALHDNVKKLIMFSLPGSAEVFTNNKTDQRRKAATWCRALLHFQGKKKALCRFL